MNIKDQIRAEIERRLNELEADWSGTPAAGWAFSEVLSFLDTLPEQPASEKLEEENKRMVYDVVYDLDGPAIMGTSEYLSVEDIAYIARHFAEWGASHLKR